MMQFAHPTLAGIFDTIHRYPTSTGQEWAWAQNVHLEGRVGPERQDGYEAAAGDLDVPTPDDGLLDAVPQDSRFEAYHWDYLQRCVFSGRRSGNPADTFLPANGKAICQAPGKHTGLVRVDDLTWPMEVMGLAPKGAGADEIRAGFKRLRHAFRVFRGLESDPALTPVEAQRQLNGWLEQWNNVRDTRPIFAAPLSSTAAKAAFFAGDGAAKAAALRDLLGLGHLLPSSGRKGPVFAAILKYEVVDVLDRMNQMPHGPTGGPMPAIDRARAFAAPTVLDGPLYPWFFPSPPDVRVPGSSFGRTVHLDKAAAATGLAVELLHPPFPYLPTHIHDIVEITDPGPAIDLHGARVAHVAKVRGEIKAAAAFGAPYY